MDHIRLEILEDFTPIAFYGYAHSVQEKIISIGEEETYTETKNMLVAAFNKKGIKAYSDNKTAFEIQVHGKRYFIGFYNWHMHIGTAVMER